MAPAGSRPSITMTVLRCATRAGQRSRSRPRCGSAATTVRIARCLARAAPRRDEGGTFVGHVVSATDVTEWRAGEVARAGRDAPFESAHNDPIRVRLPARANQLAVVRRLVAAWLEASGIAADDIARSCWQSAKPPRMRSNTPMVQPLVGSSSKPRSRDRDLTVAVRDGGRWRRKPPGAGGRGLGLMARLMDEFETRRSEQGTEVWMRRALVGNESSR